MPQPVYHKSWTEARTSQFNGYLKLDHRELRWWDDGEYEYLSDSCVIDEGTQAFFDSEMQYSRETRRLRFDPTYLYTGDINGKRTTVGYLA